MPGTFHFSIVRLVPHPIRDEALNLGVVLVSESGDFADYRFVRGFRRRLRALAPDLDPAVVARQLDDFEARFVPTDGQARLGVDPLPTVRATLAVLADQYGYQIQVSKPRPVLSDDPERTLDGLFEEFVAPIPHARRQVLDRAGIKRTVVRALRSWSVPPDLVEEKPAIPVRHGVNTLELAVRRGRHDGLAVAVEPLAFSNTTQEEIVRQRDHVAWVASDIREDVTDLKICAVLGAPIPNNRELFQESRQLFLDLQVTPLDAAAIAPLRELLLKAGVEGLSETGDGPARIVPLA